MAKTLNDSQLFSPRNIIIWTGAYLFLYYTLLGFCPAFYRLYIKIYFSSTPLMPKDAPLNVKNAPEIHGIHTYKDLQSYIEQNELEEEVVIFRNFSNCGEKFDNILYPRHKDQTDLFQVVEYSNVTKGNLYTDGFAANPTEFVEKTLTQILTEKSPYHFASFLLLFDVEDYREMLNADNSSKFLFDSSFISHFDRDLVSTPIHSAPLANTYSVQCFGTKAWLFNKASDLKKYGFMPTATPHGSILRGEPESLMKIPTVRAVVHANDVLFFPPNYYHAVASKKGKNIMFAIRQLNKKTVKLGIKSAGFVFIMQMIQRIMSKKIYANFVSNNEQAKNKKGFFMTNNYEPFKTDYLELVLNQQRELFTTYTGPGDFNDFFGTK